MSRLLLALCAGLMLFTQAIAHDMMPGVPYPRECCSGHDCAPLDPDRVKTMIGGYIVDGKIIVPYGQERKSQDGRYHACFPKPGQLRCFFAPPPAM